METYLYTCKHCNKEFRPTRRGVQKFCSDSCRVGHHQCNTRMTQRIFDSLAISNDSTKAVEKSKKKEKEKEKEEGRSEGMSLAGIGNAAAGIAITEAVINIFTPEHNKPATKGDLLNLANHLNRYRRIKNIKPDIFGKNPYLDLETGIVVYRLG